MEDITQEKAPTGRFLSPADLAALVGVPVKTVYQWNHRGFAPPALRLGKHIRYDREAVEKWLEAQAQPRSA